MKDLELVTKVIETISAIASDKGGVASMIVKLNETQQNALSATKESERVMVEVITLQKANASERASLDEMRATLEKGVSKLEADLVQANTVIQKAALRDNEVTNKEALVETKLKQAQAALDKIDKEWDRIATEKAFLDATKSEYQEKIKNLKNLVS